MPIRNGQKPTPPSPPPAGPIILDPSELDQVVAN